MEGTTVFDYPVIKSIVNAAPQSPQYNGEVGGGAAANTAKGMAGNLLAVLPFAIVAASSGLVCFGFRRKQRID
ncbi:MAG: hypothetical protein FWG10_02240 [Eubacteriaceae bacterium]|nr:hypothetical protein [Eubacteriaceae bacterium]